MRIAIVGGGPAGLFLGYLVKRSRPDWSIDIYEQNAADATFGFGIAFSERALSFLERQDAATMAAIAPALERWTDSILYIGGAEVRIDGIGYTGIGRLRLLAALQAQAKSVGVVPHFGKRIDSLDQVRADLIVGADGANSFVRKVREAEFGTTITQLTNRFSWYGTRKYFPALSHTFLATPRGAFNAHHHAHAPDMSTIVVEVDEATFLANGFDTMPLADAQRLCGETFSDTLSGQALISNNSIWRRFPRIRNARWWAGNCVLLGDALHTIHFSIGSGTRLAMDDAYALGQALLRHAPDLGAALAAYRAAREPVVEKLLAASDASSMWYEDFAQHMRLPPLEFAMSYITRSGRVDMDRLRRTSPDFVAAYEAERSTHARQSR